MSCVAGSVRSGAGPGPGPGLREARRTLLSGTCSCEKAPKFVYAFFLYFAFPCEKLGELVQHFVVRLPAEVACSCCYSHIVCCVTCDTAAFRGLTCQCDIKARSFDF